MSLFDSSQNITDVQLKLLLSKLSVESMWVFGDSCIWIVEKINNQTSLGARSYMQTSNFENVCSILEDIKPVMERFDESFDTIQVNTNSDKTIPQQIAELMKSYRPPNSMLNISADRMFINFNNDLTPKFQSIYQNYCLRHKIGQRGFEAPPENIGYLHIEFRTDEYLPYMSAFDEFIIHWFYPMAIAKK